MEFRLVYKGALRSAQSKHCVAEKHRIRKHFHVQLKELWQKDPVLNRLATGRFVSWTTPLNMVSDPGPGVKQVANVGAEWAGARSYVELLADDHTHCGFRFAPLVRKKNGFTCALDILFLRRGHPGELVVSGDLDNRVKTLLDSLKMPRECAEVRATPKIHEDPFFCLLEDDSLITSLKITTDRLLAPVETDEDKWTVELVVHVTVIDAGALLGTNGLI